MRIGRKNHLDFQISEVERELKAVSREIRVRERIERKQRRLAGYGLPGGRAGEGKEEDREETDGRRLANYLSAGSFQTTAHPKFRSDLIRRRRLLLGGAVIGLLAAVWIIWKLVF
jgi:hypothetical protein